MPPPLDARALDEESALEMCMSYDEDLWHRLHFHPSVDREAIFAQARHKKRWPQGQPLAESGAPSSVTTPAPSPAGKKRSSVKG